MRLNGILLDLDNTVYDYKSAHEPALAQTLSWLCAALCSELEDVEKAYYSARQQVNTRLTGLASSHSRLLYFQNVCEQFERKPYVIALEAEDLYWRVFLEKMEVRAGFLHWLEQMQSIPIAIISDLTTQIQFRKILRLGLENSLAAIVTSEEAGFEKPDPRIFEIAVQKLKVPASQLVMVGDSWERDMVGALGLGIKCYWWRCAEQAKALTASQSAFGNRLSQFTHFTELTDMVQALV